VVHAAADVSPVSGEVVPAGQSLQLVASSSTLDPYCPAGQASHTVDVDDAMNVPGEQHPKRPVDVKKLFPGQLGGLGLQLHVGHDKTSH